MFQRNWISNVQIIKFYKVTPLLIFLPYGYIHSHVSPATLINIVISLSHYAQAFHGKTYRQVVSWYCLGQSTVLLYHQNMLVREKP